MFELICNIALFVFLGFTFFTHVLEANIPKAFLSNPYNLMPDVWPKVIIVLLMVCIAVNVYKIIKKNKDNPDFNLKAFGKNTVGFLKSRMFIGMIILAIAALMLETVGCCVTAFFILFTYGMLLGEKKYLRLLGVSLVLALLLHVIFSGLLDVTLPRGTVPFLRSFALWLENLI